MTEVMERDPLMTPTIVGRFVPGVLEVMERAVDGAGGRMALCVFWSVEYARRDMYANGYYPEDSWRAIERDEEELLLVFDLLNELGGGRPRLAYIRARARGLASVRATGARTAH